MKVHLHLPLYRTYSMLPLLEAILACSKGLRDFFSVSGVAPQAR